MQKIPTTWADFNLYERPALFYDVKSHYPAPAQDTMYHLWRHGPVSSAPYRRMGTQYQHLAATSPAGIPPQPPDYEQMPAPQPSTPPVQIELPGELLPPLTAPPPQPAPPPPSRYETGLPADGMKPWPGKEQPTLTPPAIQGPTAWQPANELPSGVQPAGWQSARPALPGSNTVFARP